VWNSLIEHGRGQNSIIDESGNNILKRANNKWKKVSSSLSQNISESMSSWSHLPWKIVFTNDLKESFKNIKVSKLRAAALQSIGILGSGEWPKFQLECKSVSEKYRGIIYEHRFHHLKLVWSIDLCDTTYTQKLIIWDIASEASLKSVMRRVENHLNQYSEECLLRLARREKCGKVYVPYTWKREIPFTRLKDVSTKASSEVLDLERCSVGKAASLIKFYTMDGHVARRMLMMKEGQNIELPFVMSREEEEIVRRPGSVLVLGRSGTGKTTTLLHRMYFEGKCLRSHADEVDNEETMCCRQLVVTASPILCDAIRRSYCNMCETFGVKIESSTDLVLPSSFVHLEKKDYPLILTYSSFLSMLDQSTDSTYFKSRHQVESAKQSYAPELGSASSNSSHKISAALQSSESSQQSLNEVDFDRFKNYYYPRFSEKLRNICDAAAVYTEIMTSIKGSLKSLHSSNGYLTVEEYVNLCKSRQSTLDSDQRELIYDAFRKYQKLKTQEYSDYDILDVVHHVFQSLSVHGYRGAVMDSVYIDEVQDLCPAQLALLKFVCNNTYGFVFAGDTAQTVSLENMK